MNYACNRSKISLHTYDMDGTEIFKREDQNNFFPKKRGKLEFSYQSTILQ